MPLAVDRGTNSRVKYNNDVYIRKVKTASGSTTVQLAIKEAGNHKVLHHIGSARNQAELEVLLRRAEQIRHAGQTELFDPEPAKPRISTVAAKSVYLYIEDRTKISIKRFIKELETVMTATIEIAGEQIEAAPLIPEAVEKITRKL